MNQKNQQLFQQTLEEQYKVLFQTPEYARTASVTTPHILAEKLTKQLRYGDGLKDGEGVKRTCKILGIKHTYKAIEEYLK